MNERQLLFQPRQRVQRPHNPVLDLRQRDLRLLRVRRRRDTGFRLRVRRSRTGCDLRAGACFWAGEEVRLGRRRGGDSGVIIHVDGDTLHLALEAGDDMHQAFGAGLVLLEQLDAGARRATRESQASEDE